MKKLALLMAAAVTSACLGAAAPKQLTIDKVEPPYWWTGMHCDTLQILVTGPEIGLADVAVDYPGVTLQEAIRLDSPNYKFLYLTIGPDARPGTMPIHFTLGKRRATIDYQLRARAKAGEEYVGFDASDVLYLLMPDRFASDGNIDDPAKYNTLRFPVRPDRGHDSGRHGGNINGIRNHLDYLDSLGVTALWVCPVLENDLPGGSYHGYATTDYYRVDPRFGTNDEWNALVAEASDRGLKVVMDMIFNHTGVTHPWIADMPANDWFNHPEATEFTNFRLSTIHDPYVSDYDLDHTVNGWFTRGMPDLNQRNPHLLKYLTQNSIWWIESSGISGIRMDTYPYTDAPAMARWIDAVMAEYPNFNIVGECWYGNEAGSAFWQSGNKMNPLDTRLRTVMDFMLNIKGQEMFFEETTPWTGLNYVYDHLALDYLYADPQHVLTFLDNHDTDRYLLSMPDDLGAWKQGIAFLLTSRGIPQLYYGTEILMHGTKKVSDGHIRLDFPGGFPGDTINAFTPEGRTPLQREAWDFMQRILQWRRGEANDVIARGSLKHFMPQNCLYVYERRLGDRQVVVMMNGTDSPLTTTMERTAEILPYGTTLTDILTGEPVTIAEEMTFAPRQTLILQNF